MGEAMVLLKKFLIAIAISLYSVVPVFAGDSDRVRGHWQGQGAKMLNLTADQRTAWGRLKKAHLENIRASARSLRLAKERLRIGFQSSAGEGGLISLHKGEAEIRNQAAALFSLQQEIQSSQLEYQIAVWRILTPDQRLLMGVPSHRFRMSQNKGSGIRWNKGYWKSSGKGCHQGREQGHGKNSNKRFGMGGDKDAGKRGDQSRGDKWQKNRKKKSFDSD
jgi:Spy/CpxP family protein refolding chaperone